MRATIIAAALAIIRILPARLDQFSHKFHPMIVPTQDKYWYFIHCPPKLPLFPSCDFGMSLIHENWLGPQLPGVPVQFLALAQVSAKSRWPLSELNLRG